MAKESFKRKLTAILSADIEGYSRHMGEDEEATIRTLIAYREAMAVLIQQYRGRVVDAPGDNLLAEFASVVDGIGCAVANYLERVIFTRVNMILQSANCSGQLSLIPTIRTAIISWVGGCCFRAERMRP
jgi:class 3 adenylate cyclase